MRRIIRNKPIKACHRMARPSSGRNYPDHHRQPDRHRHYDANHHALRLSPRLASAEEFCRFCYIYFCFISLGYAVRNRCLLNITLLQDHLPPRVLRMALDILIQVSMLIVFIIFFGGTSLCKPIISASVPHCRSHDYPLSGHIHGFSRYYVFPPSSQSALLTGGDVVMA